MRLSASSITEKQRARFWSRVVRGPGCWGWRGARFPEGYGLQKVGKPGGNVGAHRIAWVLANGDIPDGMCVCHRCDNTGCVNPGHLFLGTHSDNMADRNGKGRARGGSLCGDNNPGAKLKSADIPRIRAMIESGAKQKDVALEFGVSSSCIGLVARGISWRIAQGLEP